VLQWPIVTLTGIRRFYARGGARTSVWHDRIALMLAVLAAVASWVGPMGLATWAQVLAVGAFSLTLYAASAVARLEDFASSSTLVALRLGMVTGALVQGEWVAALGAYLGPFVSVADGALGALLATAAIAILMTQLAPVMNLERKIAHLLASQRKLRNLVDVDALTRLPNRRHFHELAERAVEAARDAATMIVFDVDRLNRINELLGHATGDEALRQIGTALRETLRRRDVAGRLGGDEFAVVLPRTRLADSEIVISRIVARLDDRQVAPRIARVALNVGAVQFKPNETIGDALRRADAELVAKRDAAQRDAAGTARRAHSPGPRIRRGGSGDADALGVDEPDPGRRCEDQAGAVNPAAGPRAAAAGDRRAAAACPTCAPHRRRSGAAPPCLPSSASPASARRSSPFLSSRTSSRSASRCR
jgi:diguanylate cyclase (GGDEF)-like protein